jgi:hypothetical protein
MRAWASFLATALSGSALYWNTDNLTGAHLVSMRVLAWLLWIFSPIIGTIIGAADQAAAVQRANETAGMRHMDKLFEKPEPVGMVMLSETKTFKRWTFLEGIDDKLLTQIADDWAGGGKFSEPAWEGRLSAGRFRELRDLFLDRGILAWKSESHQQGTEWTAVGRGLLRRARTGLPPTLVRTTGVQRLT